MSMHISRRSLLGAAGVGAGAMFLGACGDDEDGGGGSGNEAANLEWWHISNTEPLLSKWDKLAKDYQAAHSNVTIKITPLENEAFKAKLTTVTQAGNPPHLFQSWGGGVLAQQVQAGLVKEMTGVDDVISSVIPASLEPYKIDGKQYGIAWDLGMVGFWYNKELFEKAKISAPPTTWGELLDAVGKLKSAGIVPAGLAGKDKWPAHFYYAYLCMRIAGLDALKDAAANKNWDNPDFVKAGEAMKQLIDLKPFQNGFLAAEYGTADGQAAAVGNGRAAFELMGQWAPSVQKEWSSNKQGLGDKLGFFTFPAVDGGKGAATDAFGGGNGFAVGKDAPDATWDFMKSLLTVDSQKLLAETGAIVPTVKGAEVALKDENLKAVSAALTAATGFQLYLDQAYPPAVGTQVNDSVAELVAGKADPAKVASTISATFKSQ